MIYFESNGLCLRDMRRGDTDTFCRAFSASPRNQENLRSRFEGYFSEQSSGKRIMLVAEKDGQPAGYCSLLHSPWEGPFKNKRIPEIVDFNVHEAYRRQGIGGRMLDILEGIASKTSPVVTLSVGLYASYGPAQRIYAKRGYVPDGSGIWYRDKRPSPGDKLKCDDNLVLYLAKRLTK